MVGVQTPQPTRRPRGRLSATAVPSDTVLHVADRYEALGGRAHMSGIHALVRLVLDRQRRDAAAGLRTAAFVSGYEGSPLAGYDLELLRHGDLLGRHDVVVRPGLNEEAAATAVQGSQLAQTLDGQRFDGVVGYWYGKAPGLDRATDALRHANLMGTAPRGGAVALVGDDPAAKSSTVPSASEAALADLVIPVLYPADPQDVLDLGVHAVELSRVSGLWSALKIVTSVADGSATVSLDGGRVAVRDVPGGRSHTVTGRLLQPALGPIERGQLTTRLALAAEYGRVNGLNHVTVRTPQDRVGIAAPGTTYPVVRAALARMGLPDDRALRAHGLRLLRIGMPYPLHPETVQDFAACLQQVLVVEEKRAFVETAVKDALYGRPDAPAVHGKRDLDGHDLFPPFGELDVDAVTPLLARQLTRLGVPVRETITAGGAVPPPRSLTGRRLPITATRTPVFCSGCPHNTSTRPSADTLTGAGIGCHTMVLLMDPARVGEVTGITQMGGEGVQWIGMAPFLDRERHRHYVQNLGDGTFAHSGSLAIRAAVAARVDITYRLLHNSAVAMTGGQAPVGDLPLPRLVDLLLAEGVARVLVTTEDVGRYRRVRLPKGVEVWDRSRIDEAQRVLAATPGVTVLIHDQECAAEKRRKRKRGLAPTPTTRVVINERICEGCGDCGATSGCLSLHPVDTDFGRKTRIHQSSCNLDRTCLDGDCPAFMVVDIGSAPGSAAVRREVPDLPGDAVADPPLHPGPLAGAEIGLRLAGVGGTGVVTLSQVLAVAAATAGLSVRTLDQTGLSQKGGAVVSDVVLSAGPVERPGKIASGECDVYLGLDLLAAAAPATLGVCSPGRTLAVVSTTRTPTGRMVTDVSAAFPDDADTVGRILGASDAGAAVLVDASALAVDLFGDDTSANMLMLGIAHQTGRVPVPARAIETAIELNGVAVRRNVQAFRRGRQYVADPDALMLAAGRAPVRVPAEPADDLDTLVASRAADLADYHSTAYARLFTAFLEEVRGAEATATGESVVTGAVARHLYKLMAYKDEYEVARLALDHTQAQVQREFGAARAATARVSWRLHPPALRALGMRRKLALGPWFRPGLVALHRARRLRGTRFDVFGYTEVRRTERALVTEYRRDVAEALRYLTPTTRDTVLELAALPDMVRGYEHVKLANVVRYRERSAELVERLRAVGTTGGAR
jgi:indolepyruvate ferredoxin oxidoreductase